MESQNYFSIELVLSAQESMVWRLIPLRPILPNSLEVLIEVLAPIIQQKVISRSLIVPSDEFLFSALISIGLKLVGRFELDAKPKLSSDLAQILEPIYDDLFDKLGRQAVAVFRVDDGVVHPFTHDAGEYFGFCRTRERYIVGLSVNAEASPLVEVPPSAEEWVEYRSRVIEHFSGLSRVRRSAQNLVRESFVKRADVEAVLQDCFFERPDGHLMYATAGGYRCVEMLVVCERVRGVEAGTYQVKADSRSWERVPSVLSNTFIQNIGFGQTWAEACSFWLVPIIDFRASGRKYGARAYRFCLLSAGAIIHQIALSTASFGLSSRVLGGFDDVVAHLGCGLHDEKNKMIAAFVGIGREADESQ